MQATYRIGGMTCGGCEASVKKALSRLGLQATVSLPDATATVSGEAKEEDVRKAIEDAGYDFGGKVER